MKLISFDCETTLIPPQGTSKVCTHWDTPQLVCMSYCVSGGTPQLLTWEQEEAIYEVFQDEGAIYVAHNIAFDIEVLSKYNAVLSVRLQALVDMGRVLDTRVMYLLRDTDPPNRAITLHYLAQRILGQKLVKDDGTRTSFSRNTALSANQITYAKADALVTLQLAEALRRLPLGCFRPTNAKQHHFACAPTSNFGVPDVEYSRAAAYRAWYLEHVGLAVDQDKVKEHHDRLTAECSALGVVLVSCGLARLVAGEGPRTSRAASTQDLHLKTSWSLVSTNPPTVARKVGGQVITTPAVIRMNQAALRDSYQAFAEVLGIEAPTTETGQTSMARDEWSDYVDLMPSELRTHCDYQKAQKYIGMYTKPLLEARARQVLAKYFIPGTVTMRWACSKVNLQQVAKSMRDMYRARPGKAFLTADYPTLELYTLAEVLHSMGIRGPLMAALQSGADVHKYTAALLYHAGDQEKVTKQERQSAKACFHPDVEVLTSAGWVKVSALTMGHEVANYHPHDAGVSFHKPLALTTRQSEPLLHLQGHNINLRVTPDHRMLYETNGNLRTCLAKEFRPGRVHGMRHAGSAGGRMFGSVDEDAVRQAVCVQADGSFCGNVVRFGFTRARKNARFLGLWETFSYTCRAGVHTYTVPREGAWTHLLDENKAFRADVLMSLPTPLREAFLDELRFWDGRFVRGRGTATHYSNTCKVSVDAVQAVAAITGRKTRATWTEARGGRKACCNVRISERAHSNKPQFTTTKLPSQQVFCLTTHSSYVIARDGGIPLVVGQCNFGLPGGMGKKRFLAQCRSYGLDWDEEQSEHVRQLWLEKFWDVSEYLSRLRFNLWEHKPANLKPSEWLVSLGLDPNKPVSNFALSRAVNDGKIYQVTSPSGIVVPDRRFTEAGNLPFQLLGGNTITAAFNLLCKYGLNPVAVVHDSITLEQDVLEVHQHCRLLAKCMSEALAQVCPNVPAVLDKIEVEVSEVWK